MKRLFLAGASLISFLCVFSNAAFSQDVQFRTCFWNVESGGASRNVNAERIAEEDGIHIWGLSEVKNQADADRYLIAAKDGEAGEFESILGTTGRTDRLQIIYDSEKFSLLDSGELHDLNIGGAVRAPLFAKFKIIENNTEFYFVVNHLYRGSSTGRHTQSRMLNNWVDDLELPAVVGGDMNYDWHYLNGDTDHDLGFDLLVEDGVLNWVRPSVLVPTNSSSHKSVLDFVFVSGAAITWPAESTILVKPDEFPDGDLRSDHRPVDAVFTVPGEIVQPTPRMTTRAEALARVAPSNDEVTLEPSPDVAIRRNLTGRRFAHGGRRSETELEDGIENPARLEAGTHDELMERMDRLEKQIEELRRLLKKENGQ